MVRLSNAKLLRIPCFLSLDNKNFSGIDKLLTSSPETTENSLINGFIPFLASPSDETNIDELI